jgi:hypothetical protein
VRKVGVLVDTGAKVEVQALLAQCAFSLSASSYSLAHIPDRCLCPTASAASCLARSHGKFEAIIKRERRAASETLHRLKNMIKMPTSSLHFLKGVG